MMNKDVKKTIQEIQQRDRIREEAIKKGWRSRWTLLFKAWAAADRGAHLEWLGFYDEAARVRSEYKFGPKEAAQLTAGLAINMANSQLHEGIRDDLNKTVTYGHIDNSMGASGLFKTIKSMAYTSKEQIAIIFGKYKTDAFGLPVCWSKPHGQTE